MCGDFKRAVFIYQILSRLHMGKFIMKKGRIYKDIKMSTPNNLSSGLSASFEVGGVLIGVSGAPFYHMALVKKNAT